MLFCTKLVHTISSFLENSEASFAHAIIHPVVNCNCLFPLFYVAHEFPQAAATSESL